MAQCTAGMAIYDTMQFIKPDVSTFVLAKQPVWEHYFLLLAQEKKILFAKLQSYDSSTIRGFQGQASDIEIHAKEILYLKSQVKCILAIIQSSQLKKYAEDTDRDNFMSLRML